MPLLRVLLPAFQGVDAIRDQAFQVADKHYLVVLRLQLSPSILFSFQIPLGILYCMFQPNGFSHRPS